MTTSCMEIIERTKKAEIPNYTSYPFLKSGWTVPFVTGHKYKIHWGTVGLDFDRM